MTYQLPQFDLSYGTEDGPIHYYTADQMQAAYQAGRDSMKVPDPEQIKVWLIEPNDCRNDPPTEKPDDICTACVTPIVCERNGTCQQEDA